MPETNKNPNADILALLTYLAWGAIGILIINISYFVGEEVGSIWYESSGDALSIFNGFWIGIVKAMPTVLIACAIGEFAFLFGRCSTGEVLTEKNVKTLQNGADSLIWAAVWSGIITPNLLNWIGGEYGGLSLSFRDLALAVGMMGFVMHGLALVFREAVAIKQENDEFI